MSLVDHDLERMQKQALEGNLDMARGLINWYWQVDSYEEAIEWMRFLAEKGDTDYMLDLASIYENGIQRDPEPGDPPYTFYNPFVSPNFRESVYWYTQLWNAGHIYAGYRLGVLHLLGKGTVKSTKKGFTYLLRSACCYSEHSIGAFKELSNCYASGVGAKKNLIESYIWALMDYACEPCISKDKYITDMEKSLGLAELLELAQEEADKRFCLREEEKLSWEYCLESAEKNLSLIHKEPAPVKPKPTPKPVVESDDTEDPDPNATPGIAYSYLSVCKKHFKPELVTLELVIPRKLKKIETLDFTRLKIKYDSKDTDTKDYSTLIPFRVNKAERRLLIILAAQSSVTDDEKRAESVRVILADHKNQSRVSHLNAMFRAIFPGCAKTGSERMINRQTGCIEPRLVVDTNKILSARDYPL